MSPSSVAENRQRLALLRRVVEDALDGREESHVGHPVGFVDDDDVGLAQVDRPLLHQIFQAARRGDENVDAPPHGIALRSVTDATVDGEYVAADGLCERAEFVP